MNVIFMGRAGGTPEIREYELNGSKRRVASFGIAEEIYGQEKPTWRNIAIFEDSNPGLFKFITGSGDNGAYIKPGTCLSVIAEERTNQWKTKEGEDRVGQEYLAYKISYVPMTRPKDDAQAGPPAQTTQTPKW